MEAQRLVREHLQYGPPMANTGLWLRPWWIYGRFYASTSEIQAAGGQLFWAISMLNTTVATSDEHGKSTDYFIPWDTVEFQLAFKVGVGAKLPAGKAMRRAAAPSKRPAVLIEINRPARQIRRSTNLDRFVYLMFNKRNGYYKIGFSGNPLRREKTLQAEEPDICLVAQAPGGSEAESLLHRRYKAQRLRGEWFALSDDNVVWIKLFFSNQNKSSHE